MRSKELLYAHRYTEAVEAYKRDIREQPDKNYYSGIGKALLALGKFDEALESFRHDDEIESNRTKGCFPSLSKSGTALWLIGKQREAMLEWHRAAAGILDGSIHYGDLAGGASQGLLLWYGAVTLNDAAEREYALNYLRTLSERKVYGKAVLWPRPVMLMILGDRSFTEVLNQMTGSLDLSESLRQSKADLSKRRQLCQLFFYSACQERESGDEATCLQKMQWCYGLENPIIEMEWYLARAEFFMASQTGKLAT